MSIKFLIVLAAVLSTTACVNTTPQWDRQFGQSVHGAIANQTIDPAAAANRNQVLGIDGSAALGAQQRYERTFAQPEAHGASMLGETGRK
jgi:hypothetical protein